MTNLDELKRLLAERHDSLPDNCEPSEQKLWDALPDLIARVEATEQRNDELRLAGIKNGLKMSEQEARIERLEAALRDAKRLASISARLRYGANT